MLEKNMAETNLIQSEADALLAMEKIRITDEIVEYPTPGNKVTIDLVSIDGREYFLLDIEQGRIDISKVKFQNRARQTVILARLEIRPVLVGEHLVSILVPQFAKSASPLGDASRGLPNLI